MSRIVSMFTYLVVSVLGALASLWLASAFIAPSYSQAPPTNQSPPTSLPPAAAQVPITGQPALDLPPPAADIPPPGGMAPAQDTQISPNEENFIYDPAGKRDPFQQDKPELRTESAPTTGGGTGTPAPEMEGQAPAAPQRPLEALEEFETQEIRVVAIIWDTKNPKALLQDPSGKLHSAKLKSRIGKMNGSIVAIREGEIVVAEKNADGTRKFEIMTLKK